MGTVGAFLYDLQMALASGQLDPRRQALVGGASGRVLEIGVGTGRNLPFYQLGADVVGLDPDSGMLLRAQRRANRAPVPVRLVAANGEALPFRPASFDAAVVALTLCSVESQEQVLSELCRVLKPGGRLHFMEHVRSDAAGWARLQDAVTPFWKTVAGG